MVEADQVHHQERYSHGCAEPFFSSSTHVSPYDEHEFKLACEQPQHPAFIMIQIPDPLKEFDHSLLYQLHRTQS